MLAALRLKECVYKEAPSELALKEGKELTGPPEGAGKQGTTAGTKAPWRGVEEGPTLGSPEGESLAGVEASGSH